MKPARLWPQACKRESRPGPPTKPPLTRTSCSPVSSRSAQGMIEMRTSSLIWRALAAIFLTGIVSALTVALGTAVVFSFGTGRRLDPQFIAVVWFFGSIIAAIAAAVLGLVCEWPKAAWLAKRDYGLAIQLFLSASAALVLLLIFLVLTHGPSANRIPPDEDWWIFPSGAFLVGGLCSGAFWWKLVVLPWRSARTI